VFFCGTGFPERTELFEEVEWGGVDFRLFGNHWDIGPNHALFLNYRPGTLDNEEVVKWYSNSKISLNSHRLSKMGDFLERVPGGAKIAKAWSLGPRAYEIAACGGFQLCDDHRPELKEVFGDTVATYPWGDAVALQDRIAYYLEHEEERKEMARAARERVEPCIFVNRAKDAIKLMEV